MQVAITATVSAHHPHLKPSVSFLRPSPPHRVRIQPSAHRLSTRASAMASSAPQQLTITRPDDWHLHLRDGQVLAAVLPHRFAEQSSTCSFQ
jgi:dihydroorotase